MKNWHSASIRVAVLCGTALTATNIHAAQVQDLRLGREEGKTRLVFDLSGPATYSLSIMDNPYRVVINIDQSDTNQVLQPPLAGTPINAVRHSVTDSGNLEVTLDLTRKVVPEVFILTPYHTRGDRLVVDLHEMPYPSPVTASTVDATMADVSTEETRGPQKPKRTTSATTSQQETLSKPKQSSKNQQGTRIGFSGTWEQEWAYQTKDTGTQKFESIIEPRLDVSFTNGSELVAITRVRLDTTGDLGPTESRPENYSAINGPIYNSEYAELSLRELYIDAEWAGIYWRLGKQQVVWGQADGIKVLDVVNPQSFREFILDDFDDSRIPLWMVNAEIPLGSGDLQLLWVPDTSYHELAELDTPYFLTAPKWIPTIPANTGVRVAPFDKPNNPLDDSDLGLRYSAFVGGWDLTLNYLYHYQDYPVLYQALDEGVLVIEPTYERNHLFGSTLSNAFNSFTLRAELAYSTETYHSSNSLEFNGIRNSAEFASVVGLDWQYSGSGLLSAQWFLSYLPDYTRDIIRDESENTLSLLFQQGFANDSWQLRVVGLYSLNDEDSLVQLRLNYWLLSNVEIWLGGDFFSGTAVGSFGQFDDQDRLILGLEYGF